MGQKNAPGSRALTFEPPQRLLNLPSLSRYNRPRPKNLLASLQSKRSDPQLHGRCLRGRPYMFVILIPSDPLIAMLLRPYLPFAVQARTEDLYRSLIRGQYAVKQAARDRRATTDAAVGDGIEQV